MALFSGKVNSSKNVFRKCFLLKKEKTVRTGIMKF